MRHLSEFAKQEGFGGSLAYYNRNWRRRDAPLLDHMGAVIDHLEAHSTQGPSIMSNLVTSCNKCNAYKSASPADVFSRRFPLRPVRGKYGEPEDWDGLSTLFILLVTKNPGSATSNERAWLRALEKSVPAPTNV
jgi:HNH endonuclease